MARLIGCCGWSEARASYLAQFRAVELQTPFYEMPSIPLALKWRESAPAPFRFSIKAWQLITHTGQSPTYRRLKSKLSEEERGMAGGFRPTELVWLAWERTRDVARALEASVVLFQCPKSFTPERENIVNFRAFFSNVEREMFQLAWEPRGEWPAELVRELCAEFDLIHCVDPFDRPSAYGASVYWRLHGRGGYSYRYTDQDLLFLHEGLRGFNGEAWVMFNNILRKEDARRFQKMIALPELSQSQPKIISG